MSTSKILYLDFETNGGAIDRKLTDVWCVGLAVNDDAPFIVTENIKEVIQGFVDDGYTLVMHNASFDLWVAETIGVTGIHKFHDTLLIHYLVSPLESHSLANLGEALGYPKLTSSSFDDGYTEQMGDYCMRDVEICREVFKTYNAMLIKLPLLRQLYYSVELPFIRCIIDMEVNGVHIDEGKWRDVLVTIEGEHAALANEMSDVPPQIGRKSKTKRVRPDEQVSQTPEIGKWCLLEVDESLPEYKWGMWEPFNPASPAQVKNVLGLDVADKEALEECGIPLANTILEYRKLDKILTTYGASLLSMLHEDGRLHGSYNQTVTRTGRLSSSKPNLQNIPSRGEVGSILRALFTAPAGRKLVSIDLDQFQLRIYAWYLKEMVPDMPDAHTLADDFNNNPDADPHQAKADMLGIPRSVGKTLNFATLFGASPAKAAVTGGTTVEEMKGFFLKQEELFPSDKELKEMVVRACRNHKGTIYDLYGRRGWYPDINEKDWGLKGRAERQAFNFIIQGTEASIVKMIGIEARQRLLGKASFIMQVHDEITFECDESVANEVADVLNSVVNDNPWLPGLKVTGSASIGDNWHDIH
jgi:DNA polymerase-1